MKIVIDDKIPYIREAISRITADAVYRKGTEISPADVRDADALIVRTRTRCDEALLGGSSVRFVATATIGFDHIDAGYMRRAGIEWMSCPGCNAASVAQYVRSVLLLLKRQKGMRLTEMTMGIVGCGHVGSKVARAAERLGMRILVCDPPRQERGDILAYEPSEAGAMRQEGTAQHESRPLFVGMEQLMSEADVITFHVPLVRTGRWSTLHLASEDFFSRLSRRPVVINTSRGEVVDNEALLNALLYNKVADAVIDTWENEPLISLPLLNRVWIGTPHIAGYSADGKVNADNMVIAGLCRHFGLQPQPPVCPPPLPPGFNRHGSDEELSLRLYNPMDDSLRLKADPAAFEAQRGSYPLRREHL